MKIFKESAGFLNCVLLIKLIKTVFNLLIDFWNCEHVHSFNFSDFISCNTHAIKHVLKQFISDVTVENCKSVMISLGKELIELSMKH